MISLKVLVEDKILDGSNLESEHGLSFYIETPAQKFIFDCGQTDLAWKNALKLGVDLHGINFAVISHAHYDHAGGFPALLKFANLKKIYTGRNFWLEKFSKTEDGYKYRGAGFSFQDLARRQIEQKVCDDILELGKDCWLIGNFDTRYKVSIPEKFVRGENKIPDNFDDEICLVLREGDGVAVVVGCAHVGILNIVATIQKRLDLPIKTVIGGIHSDDMKIFARLEDFGVENFYLCHCTGENLRADFATGSTLKIG
ncbi:MAG: MBL fold metallo-hydrolase [Selenomonadaceae bacterium]|nr:MBL fold metallo-hydrolase [Selenomonadaceae bacterium]